MKAMLLAAGRGERLRPITDTLPKPLVKVRGKPLIDYHLEALARAGVDSVVINLGWLGEQISSHVGSGSAYGLTVAYSPEGDMPLPLGLADDADGHLVLVPRPSHRDNGDFSLASGRVSNEGPLPLTFSGVAVYRPGLFADAVPGRFPLAPILREAADRGRLSGETWQGEWHDVGTPDRLAALNRTER